MEVQNRQASCGAAPWWARAQLPSLEQGAAVDLIPGRLSLASSGKQGTPPRSGCPSSRHCRADESTRPVLTLAWLSGGPSVWGSVCAGAQCLEVCF